MNNNLKELFVPYNEALALKELGFEEECFGYYENGEYIFWYDSRQEHELLLNCLAPTFSQAFKFFRDKFKLHSYIDISIENDWYFLILNLNTKTNSEVEILEDLEYGTFEETELECLRELIEICKKKKK